MKRKIIIIITIIVAVLAISITTFLILNHISKSNINLDLYFLNTNKTEIKPLEIDISYSDVNELPSKVLKELKKDHEMHFLSNSVPSDASVNSVSISEDGSVGIDFDENFIGVDANVNTLRVYAVTKSLCNLSPMLNIGSVTVTVNSMPIEGVNGNEIGTLFGKDIRSLENITEHNFECILYYIDKENGGLRGEKRTISNKNGETIETTMINEMIKEPVSEQLTNALSNNVSLISAEVADNTCFVNFGTFNSQSENELALEAITKTLCGLSNIEKVVFLINGKRM